MSEATNSAMPKATWKQAVQAAVGLLLAGLIIGYGVPYFAHTGWTEIWHHVGKVGWRALELLALMLGGLWLFTFCLTGGLPGLSHVKALILNVSGSAVSNILPGGGAIGMAATYMMARTWGFTKRNISTMLIVTGVWNVLARVAMPLLGIAALANSGATLPKSVRTGAFYGGLSGLVILVAFVAVLASKRWTALLGDLLDRHVAPVIGRLRRGAHAGETPTIKAHLVDQRARMAVVTARGWLPMTVGVVGQLGLWFVMFWQAMDAVGVNLPIADLFAAYAVGRLLTAVSVTPGGLGFTEAGTIAVLVAMGADKPAAAAGAIVFSLFTHVLEIPLGALGWLGWWVSPKVAVSDDENDGPDQLSLAT